MGCDFNKHRMDTLLNPRSSLRRASAVDTFLPPPNKNSNNLIWEYVDLLCMPELDLEIKFTGLTRGHACV